MFWDSEYDYVVGVASNSGKRILLGPYKHGATEVDYAKKRLFQPQVFTLKTHDRARASAEIKARLFKQSGDADNAIKRMFRSEKKEDKQELDDFGQDDGTDEI